MVMLGDFLSRFIWGFFLRTLAVVFALFGVFALMCCFLEVLVWWGYFFSVPSPKSLLWEGFLKLSSKCGVIPVWEAVGKEIIHTALVGNNEKVSHLAESLRNTLLKVSFFLLLSIPLDTKMLYITSYFMF